MSGLITAAAIGTVGAIGGGIISANAAENQQNKGFAQQQRGIGQLETIQNSQQHDPRLKLLRQMVEQRLLNPNALSPRIVELMKAQGAADTTRAAGGALDAIRARAGASGSGRSGTTLAAEGRVAQGLGSSIASLNRGVDIQAAQSQQQGEMQAMQMLAQLLGIEQQPGRDIANAYLGVGAQTVNTQSPWAGFGQQVATAGGSIAANSIGALQAQQQQAQQQAMYERLLSQLNGGGSAVSQGNGYVPGLLGGGGP